MISEVCQDAVWGNRSGLFRFKALQNENETNTQNRVLVDPCAEIRNALGSGGAPISGSLPGPALGNLPMLEFRRGNDSPFVPCFRFLMARRRLYTAANCEQLRRTRRGFFHFKFKTRSMGLKPCCFDFEADIRPYIIIAFTRVDDIRKAGFKRDVDDYVGRVEMVFESCKG